MSKKQCIVQFDYKASENDEINLTKGDKVVDVEECSDQEGWCIGTNQNTKQTGLFPDNFVKFIEIPTENSIPKTNNTELLTRSRESSGNNHIPAINSSSSPPQPPPPSKKPINSKLLNESNSDTSFNKKFKVTFAYKADNSDELNLQIGDVVEFLKDIEEGWAEGKCNGKVGLYPTNFVQEIKNTPSIVQVQQIVEKPEEKKPTLIPVNSSTNINPPSNEFLRNSQGKRLLKADFPYKANNKDELSFKKNDIVTLVSEDGGDPGWWKGELNGKIGVFPDNFVSALKVGDQDRFPALSSNNNNHKSFKNDAMVQDLKQKIGSKSATTTPMTDTE